MQALLDADNRGAFSQIRSGSVGRARRRIVEEPPAWPQAPSGAVTAGSAPAFTSGRAPVARS
eukprot:4831765-Pyramimonas_sp.AAC.1